MLNVHLSICLIQSGFAYRFRETISLNNRNHLKCSGRTLPFPVPVGLWFRFSFKAGHPAFKTLSDQKLWYSKQGQTFYGSKAIDKKRKHTDIQIEKRRNQTNSQTGRQTDRDKDT